MSRMRPPNIVFILLDDLGQRDLGCYGSTFYETPNLDRLAAQGMRFTDAYAACPVCSPTRASILSGKYPARVGVTNYIAHNDSHPARGRLIDAPYIKELPRSETSLATALREGGYQTWHVGKWHLGLEPTWPDRHGFDVNIGGCQMGHPWSGYFAPWNIPTLPEAAPGTYLTDHLTDRVIHLIDHSDGRPFFLNLWHYAVHTPIQAPAELVPKYQRKAARLGLDKLDAIEVGECFPCEHKKTQRVERRRLQSSPTYAAMIENLDTNIGRVLDALDRSGQADNTIVIFTSDNGGLSTAETLPTCNAPLAEGKGWIYDGGVREPLLVRWPGRVRAGSVCDVPVTSTDFYPTLLQAAGLPLRTQQHPDGESLLPLLTESGTLQRDAIFWHYPHYGNQGGTPGCAVRSGDWKLIEFFEDGRLELYNLRDDISESRNLAGEQPEIVARLHRRLVDWRESVAALRPAPNPGWQP